MQLLSLVDFWMFSEAFTFPFSILVLWWVTDFICLFLLGWVEVIFVVGVQWSLAKLFIRCNLFYGSCCYPCVGSGALLAWVDIHHGKSMLVVRFGNKFGNDDMIIVKWWLRQSQDMPIRSSRGVHRDRVCLCFIGMSAHALWASTFVMYFLKKTWAFC